MLPGGTCRGSGRHPALRTRRCSFAALVEGRRAEPHGTARDRHVVQRCVEVGPLDRRSRLDGDAGWRDRDTLVLTRTTPPTGVGDVPAAPSALVGDAGYAA